MRIDPPDLKPNARLSVSQVCKYLEIGETSLRRYCAQGKIRSYLNSTGTRRHFLGKDINLFWHRHK